MTYSIVSEFIIYGSPSRKSNSRIYTGGSAYLSKYAQEYKKIALKQLERIKLKNKNIPFDNRNYYWYFKIYYNNKKSDASIELIFDILQEANFITNDNNIRYYTVEAKELDKITPRTEIKIFECNYDKE